MLLVEFAWNWLSLQGIKIALKDEPIPTVTEIDGHVLQLYWTLEKLHQQLNILDVRVTRSDSRKSLVLNVML
jgi:hypothetical protein